MENERKAKILVSFLKRRYGDFARKHTSRNRTVFRTLIACVLSQRTRDENTAKASERLFSVADTPEKILKIPEEEIRRLIRPAGTFRQKAKRIREISRMILERYNGRVPKDREELMKLPGVGFKTADITLSYGFGVPTIAVDTHVNRISKRLGFVGWKADVEEVRKKLESLIHGKDRFVVNIGLVRFGQEICRPLRPRCPECPLRMICDYHRDHHVSRKDPG